MSQSSRWTSIGREILLRPHRTVHEPAVPRFRAGGKACGRRLRYTHASLPTRVLFFSGAWLAQQYERSRANANRAYSHTLSPLSAAPSLKDTRTRCRSVGSCRAILRSKALIRWITAARGGKGTVRRQNIYRELRDELPVLTAEAVACHFRRTRLNSYDCYAHACFRTDEHTLWYKEDDDRCGAPLAAAGRADADRDGTFSRTRRKVVRLCGSS